MSLARTFVIGFVSGLALVLSLGSGLGGGLLLLLTSLPLVVLGTVALFGANGWQLRLARGALGAALAGAAGLAAVLCLKSRTDWFDWHDDHGARLWFMILVALSAFPGGVAAAAASPGRGFALAGGFTCGVASLYLMPGSPSCGLLVLLGLGTMVGTLVGALGRDT